MTEATGEPDVAIQGGVYALGGIVMPDKLKHVMETGLENLHGADYLMVPYSLAKSMFDMMDVQIRKKVPSLLGTGQHLIEFNRQERVFRLTQLGEMSLKKLSANLKSKPSV